MGAYTCAKAGVEALTVQPLTERLMLRDLDRLAESVRLAEAPGETEAEDPVLGASARDID